MNCIALERLSRVIGVVVAVTAVTGVLEAQRPPQSTSTTVHGRVVADTSGAPVPFARVRIAGASASVRTDIDGTFSLEVPRTSTLDISKAGYVTVTRTLPPAAAALEIRLTAAAALSGRVVNDGGDPVVGAKVTAAAINGVSSARRVAASDDRGEYRIGGLPPGQYRVSVETTGAEEIANGLALVAAGQASAAQTAAMPSGVAGGAQAIATLQQTTTLTYYPDALDVAHADVVTVGEGDQRADIDVHLPADRALRQFVSSMSLPALIGQPAADSGGGTIRGSVRDPQGRPVPYAQVTLQGSPTSNGPGAVAFSTKPTDERGAFEFSGLRPGSYSVTAAKAGYSGTPSASSPQGIVSASDVYEQNITLVPWGVISGRLRDEFGDPVAGAKIVLLQSRYERGRRRLVEARAGTRMTDDRGDFRLFAIPRGDYVLAASVGADTAAELYGYAQTFYPGSLTGAEARPLTIEVGTDLAGLDFALLATPTTRVAGRTFDAAGMPTTQLRLTLAGRNGGELPLVARIETDGTFTFESVPSGQYVLKADSGRTNTYTEGEFTAITLNVPPSGLSGIRVQASPGSTITGRFVFDRSQQSSDPPPTAVTISAVPEDFDLAPASVAATSANAEGVFQLRGVTGMRRLQVTRVPPRYMVRAVLVNGRDVTDELMPFGSVRQSIDNVEVVLTDRISQLTGRVTREQTPVGAGVHVVVFATDRERWYSASRYLHHQVTNADGAFTFSGLPAGSYFVAAARSIPSGDDAWQDPAFLDAIRSAAIVTSVTEGQVGVTVVRLTSF